MHVTKTSESSFDIWSAAVDHELSFWDHWFATRGREWPDDYRARLDPDSPLSAYHRGFIDHLPHAKIRILDVGAGPLTLLGKTHPSKALEIVAVDALAERYDALIEKYGVKPPVRTIAGHAESLTRQFADSSFDLVTANNCIDHCYDPVLAVRQMVRVVKPGCIVALDHAENEADNEHHIGMHQWNFTIEKGHFIIRGRDTTTDVSEAIAGEARVECDDAPRNKWVQVHIRKHV